MMKSSSVFGDDAVKDVSQLQSLMGDKGFARPNRALILIPTYNEVKNVGRMIDRIALGSSFSPVVEFVQQDREAEEGRLGSTTEKKQSGCGNRLISLWCRGQLLRGW